MDDMVSFLENTNTGKLHPHEFYLLAKTKVKCIELLDESVRPKLREDEEMEKFSSDVDKVKDMVDELNASMSFRKDELFPNNLYNRNPETNEVFAVCRQLDNSKENYDFADDVYKSALFYMVVKKNAGNIEDVISTIDDIALKQNLDLSYYESLKLVKSVEELNSKKFLDEPVMTEELAKFYVREMDVKKEDIDKRRDFVDGCRLLWKIEREALSYVPDIDKEVEKVHLELNNLFKKDTFKGRSYHSSGNMYAKKLSLSKALNSIAEENGWNIENYHMARREQEARDVISGKLHRSSAEIKAMITLSKVNLGDLYEEEMYKLQKCYESVTDKEEIKKPYPDKLIKLVNELNATGVINLTPIVEGSTKSIDIHAIEENRRKIEEKLKNLGTSIDRSNIKNYVKAYELLHSQAPSIFPMIDDKKKSNEKGKWL